MVQVPSLYCQQATPPWCEHAPDPVAVLFQPSAHLAPTRYLGGGGREVAVAMTGVGEKVGVGVEISGKVGHGGGVPPGITST
jgi:hypothetical protein